MNTLDTAIHALRQGIKDCDKEIKQLEKHKKQMHKALEQLGIDPASTSNVRITNPRRARVRVRREQAILWLNTVKENSDPDVEFTAYDYFVNVSPDDSSLTLNAAQNALWKLADEGFMIQKAAGRGRYKFKDELQEQMDNDTGI